MNSPWAPIKLLFICYKLFPKQNAALVKETEEQSLHQ